MIKLVRNKWEVSIRGVLSLLAITTVMITTLAGCVTVKTEDTQTYEVSYPQSRKVQPIVNGSIFNADSSRPLFEDIKARYVGDILTVVLVEKTDAKKSANTDITKDSTTSTGALKLFGKTLGEGVKRNVLDMDIDKKGEFAGAGDSDQSNSLTGTIAVTVAEVFPNGNLFVRGQKRVHINQGDEYIRISGIVRVADIKQNNSISSTLIADAQITYSGTGAVADSNAMGWVSRFFNSPLWPL